MELKDYTERLKFELTGGILECELKNKDLEKIVNYSIREINNYYNVTQLLQLEASECIDLSEHPEINNIIGVHRITYGNAGDGIADPTYMSYLQMYNIGQTYYNPSNMIYNLGTYFTAQQIANTMSTDLAFRYDEASKKLYVNFSQGVPPEIVIEYVPRLIEASDVLTEHWQDMLYRLSLANAKIALGRIRTRYVQENALYTDDGATILAEGLAEAEAIRDRLKANADLVLPID